MNGTRQIMSEMRAFAGRFEDAIAGTIDTLLANAPARLLASMRHGTLDGGKRLRPFLLARSAALFGMDEDCVMPAAVAIECVHCYSLIHDDLPAMDDDDMRRGRPTVHKAYGEATAILAGDCLLTLAFESLSRAPEAHRLIPVLARASGGCGMVGGQMLDLAAEGRFENATESSSEESVTRIQSMKTGALITAACAMGALAARADDDAVAALTAYGEKLGLAFQIADDLLDHEGDAAALGKAVRKDADAGKATFVSLRGADGARELLDETVQSGIASLETLSADTSALADLAIAMSKRDR